MFGNRNKFPTLKKSEDFVNQTVSLPPKFEGYQRDEQLEASYRGNRMSAIGCWSVAAFLAMGAAFLAYLMANHAPQGQVAGTVAALFIGLCVALYLLVVSNDASAARKNVPCLKCKKSMETVQAPCPLDQARETDVFGYQSGPDETATLGADGYVYGISVDKSGGSSRLRYSVYRVFQRWYACESCRVCFAPRREISIPTEQSPTKPRRRPSRISSLEKTKTPKTSSQRSKAAIRTSKRSWRIWRITTSEFARLRTQTGDRMWLNSDKWIADS
jgi:hypothetical protein